MLKAPNFNSDLIGSDLHDFLVEDIEIESSDNMDFQIGGDACGERQNLRFRTSPVPVQMVRLNGARYRAPRPINLVRGLLPAFKAQS